MKKLIFLAFLPVLTISCNLFVPIDNNNNDNDSIDSIAADSMQCDIGDVIEYSDGLRPLYVFRFNDHQFFHPFSFEEMYSDNEYEYKSAEGYSCEEMIANAKLYTLLEDGPRVYSARFKKVQKGDWSHGNLNGMPDNPDINGLLYDVDGTFDEYTDAMLLVDEDFSNSHIPQYVENYESYVVAQDRPMPKELKAKLEKELGYTIERSHKCATISDPANIREDAHLYILQTYAKNQKKLGAIVLEWDGKIAYLIDEAYYYPDEEPEYSWHVDDGGIYLPRTLMAAFYNMDGDLELYYEDQSAESTDFCVMTIEGKKLVSKVLNSYYNYYN